MDQSISEARALQNEMSQKVLLADLFETPRYIAGMDVSNNRFDPNQMVFGAGVVFSYPSLEIVETANQADQQKFPYVPGLLGFREVPTLVRAFQKLAIRPDLIMVDGHGVSHPRGFGVATHLGVVLDIPTIGVAKSILCGKPEGDLSDEAGSTVPLIWKGKEIGTLLRTKKRCLPLIISAGHKITLKTAVQLVMSCLRGRRLPETTLHAHLAANECRKAYPSINIEKR